MPCLAQQHPTNREHGDVVGLSKMRLRLAFAPCMGQGPKPVSAALKTAPARSQREIKEVFRGVLCLLFVSDGYGVGIPSLGSFVGLLTAFVPMTSSSMLCRSPSSRMTNQ